MKTTLPVLALASLLLNAAAVFAAPLTNSHVIELAVHRIERLTELKKIDTNYANKLASMSLSLGAPADIANGAYTVLISQSPGADQSVNQMQMILGTDGKAIKETIVKSAAPAGEPNWTTVSPLTLLENAFHYLMENGENSADLKVFVDSVVEASIHQLNVDNTVQGQVLMTNSQNSKKLEIILDSNGNFVSAKVI